MTLLICILAAIIASVCWYYVPKDDMKLSTLCFIYWGASLMWMVDAYYAYLEAGPVYFDELVETIGNDTLLGCFAVAFGLLIWMIQLFITDPQGKIRKMLLSKE